VELNQQRLRINCSELFVKPDGSLYQEGDLLKNPKLAATLKRIAADPMTFHNGTLAQDIVQDLHEYGTQCLSRYVCDIVCICDFI